MRTEVQRLITTLAGDQTGFIIAPCHNLQPNTALENIIALYEAAHDDGSWGGMPNCAIPLLIWEEKYDLCT